MRFLIVLYLLAITPSAFAGTATLDSISTFGKDVDRIKNKLLYETSFIDGLFKEDYFIFLAYRPKENKKMGCAIGDFKTDKKIFQFEIIEDKIKYWSITKAPMLKHYLKLIDSFEKSIIYITSQFRDGFYIDYENKSTEWDFLSYTKKNGESLKRNGFLSYERIYPSSILTEEYPNTVDKLIFYGIILATQPISNKDTERVVIDF